MSIQTRSQKIAQAVLNSAQGREIDSDMKSLANGFPSLVLQSGLAQALSFYSAKKHDTYLDWLNVAMRNSGLFSGTNNMLTTASNADLTQYRQFTRDTLEAAMWIKRHVQANAPT